MSQKPAILLPIDFSDCSYSVVAEGARLARMMGARVVLLNVAEAPSGLSTTIKVQANDDAPLITIFDYLEQKAAEQLPPFELIVRTAGVEVSSMNVVGHASEQIVATADELGVEMIFMGTRGRKGLSRLLLGSTAEYVVRHANCPVTTVRAKHRPECEATNCEWCAD